MNRVVAIGDIRGAFFAVSIARRIVFGFGIGGAIRRDMDWQVARQARSTRAPILNCPSKRGETERLGSGRGYCTVRVIATDSTVVPDVPVTAMV
jgi:hypothetical protein